ncbi:hypothetical protein [Nocardiopsis sp. FR6]|uniref:hypothetical protein n=1 Tax=Nocardiopsis sp. FR6 TaxID=2605986 RepID=UPI00135B2389
MVVVLDASDGPWRRAARMVVLSHELGRFSTPGESVCVLGRHRIAVVAPDAGGLDARLDELRRGSVGEHGAAL